MEDILKLIKGNTDTEKDFRQWLFNKLNKNQQNFANFAKYPNDLKIPFLIKYLESKGVNILEASIYYNVVSDMKAGNFEELLAFVIIKEFKRIEESKTISYVPF